MFVRTVYVTGDPALLEDTLDALRGESVKLLSAQPGYRGYGLFANRELGTLTMGSWWDTTDHEEASDTALAERRDTLLVPFASTVAVDRWEAVAAETGPAVENGGFRLVRFAYDPAKLDGLVRGFTEQGLPEVRKIDGFVGTAMLIDRHKKIGTVGAIFADRQAFEASRGPQAAIRSGVTKEAGSIVYGLEEFDVVLLDRP
ncbi:hypothetical protein [Streptomyces sp. TLI_171]|uniref:hypothetical protein n=1 Tax=Streptomyces sp. TLI_171 TaxID=1938859 RepID=UPI000C193E5A|nr:hypothetical protein [Streptomyces sp. TLI_171]RKE18039.1 hypothetical protein BX266_1310 [Streptomyces sp. TLI_171]